MQNIEELVDREFTVIVEMKLSRCYQFTITGTHKECESTTVISTQPTMIPYIINSFIHSGAIANDFDMQNSIKPNLNIIDESRVCALGRLTNLGILHTHIILKCYAITHHAL